jgi:hypothetical protein
MGYNSDNAIDTDKEFRIKLASIAAKELLGAKWLRGVEADAKAISDICVGQANSAISRAVCSADDPERAQDLVTALGPEFFRTLAASMLCSTIMVSNHLAKTYLSHKQN